MNIALGPQSNELLQLLIGWGVFVGRNEVLYDIIKLLLLGCQPLFSEVLCILLRLGVHNNLSLILLSFHLALTLAQFQA